MALTDKGITTMNSLTRCMCVINHEMPDRVPVIAQDAQVAAYLAGLNCIEYATDAEKRAGRPLFDEIAWSEVVDQTTDASTGDWVRILHAVLRRKARSEVAGDEVRPVTTADLKREVDRFMQMHNRIPVADGGNYV